MIVFLYSHVTHTLATLLVLAPNTACNNNDAYCTIIVRDYNER